MKVHNQRAEWPFSGSEKDQKMQGRKSAERMTNMIVC